MNNSIYYRPEWTCGRYNSLKHVAIYYNLIEGMSYFFEEESADVMGAILSFGRNGGFSLEEISCQTNIEIDTLIPFFEELIKLNLVTKSIPNPEGITGYRHAVADWKKKNPFSLDKSTKEKLPFEVSNAELEYTKKVGGITSVMLELTYNCSEQCVHCYNIGASHSENQISHRDQIKGLDFEDYKKIIEELYTQGLFKVSLSGGDPFSNPNAWDIIEYLYDKEIAFDILTNGQKLTGQTLKLAEYYPRSVGVSVYSSEPGIHDKITRVPGSWKKSIHVLEELGDLSVPLNIKCCIMQPNFTTYKGIADIAKSVGGQPQFEVSVTDSVEGDKYVSQNLRLTSEQYKIVLRDANIPLYVGPEAPNYGGQKKDMKSKGCRAGENSFCIRPDGEVIPCCSFHLSFGNLRNESIKEILKSENLKEWLEYSLEDNKECGREDYCDYCNLCPGLAYSEHGDFKKASENCCYIAKIRYNLADKLRKNE